MFDIACREWGLRRDTALVHSVGINAVSCQTLSKRCLGRNWAGVRWPEACAGEEWRTEREGEEVQIMVWQPKPLGLRPSLSLPARRAKTMITLFRLRTVGNPKANVRFGLAILARKPMLNSKSEFACECDISCSKPTWRLMYFHNKGIRHAVAPRRARDDAENINAMQLQMHRCTASQKSEDDVFQRSATS